MRPAGPLVNVQVRLRPETKSLSAQTPTAHPGSSRLLTAPPAGTQPTSWSALDGVSITECPERAEFTIKRFPPSKFKFEAVLSLP